MSDYFELSITINPKISDIVSDICFENFECDGVILAEEAYKDLEMTSTTEGTLKAFIRSDVGVADVLKTQRDLLLTRGFTEEDLGSWDFTVSKVENQDWSKKWKENWDVTRVSERIIVVPTWIEYEPKPDEVVIYLDPGCAFGTGTHQTTQLCMRAIEKYMQIGAKMADIGMGSGILAICAKKFGASEVFGCDNDETVIEVARENAVLNKVECEFKLAVADELSQKYDFICANILHNVLADIMSDLKSLMKPGATMVLSGILDEKKPIVLDAISKHGLKLLEEVHQDQWVGLIVKV